ncbi:MAG: hypothetical protein AB2L14_18120 [Candidatus Xenobiia bacterium LiM19]
MGRRKRLIQSRRTYKDSTLDENLQAGRARAVEQDPALFDVNECVPLVPNELHELARHISSRYIHREADFITFDYHLCRLSHARSLIDLCLGELLSAFRKNDGKAYGEMGYSKLDDFADEHLSFSGRLASELILNFERLQALPLTREAYIKGDIVKSALRLLLRVMTPQNEAELLGRTRDLSVREIDELVKAELRSARKCDGKENNAGGDDSATVAEKGSEVIPSVTGANDAAESISSLEEQESEAIPSEEADREEGSGVVMKFSVPRTLALTWDFALEHYRENEKTKGPLYGFVEALVASFLDSTAGLVAPKEPEGEDGAGGVAGTVAGTTAVVGTGSAGVSGSGASVVVGAGASAGQEGDKRAVSEDGPATVGGREVPLLYTDAIWDCFPSEREFRSHNRDGSLTPSGEGVCGAAESGDCRVAGAGGCGAAGTGDCRAAGPGCARPEEAVEEYPDLQNEERLRHIREELDLQPFIVNLPEEYSQIPSDPYMLSHKIISVAQMRQSIDYHIGWFLKAVHDRRLYRIMEFSKIEDYAKARINISASTTFRLIKLVSYFSNHPVIEKAFLRRKITREQAYQIASLQDGRYEKIWLDFAMSRPARELREEVNRIVRIKEYDYFASHYYALLPGFRYITDDRYYELSDEMKDILRTGAWYKGPGSEWPLSSHDEHFLDKDFADKIADTLESEVTGLSKCAPDRLEEMEQTGAVQLSMCGPDHLEESGLAESSQLSKCAADNLEKPDPEKSSQLSKCATDFESAACLCREGDRHHSDETLEQARELCTLPDKHRPAMTLLLDVLESLERQSDGKGSCASPAVAATTAAAATAASTATAPAPATNATAPAAATAQAPATNASAEDSSNSRRHEPAMSIRFFIPRGLYGVWNEAVRRYVSLVSPDDGIELLVNNEGVANFIAIMLSEYLLAEKAHHKAAHNNKVLERDGYKCQVPGCSNRRNIHAHHLEFRSHGGCNATSNLLSLCASHHLWILHILHGLKIEGTAPDDLTFTFGPCSSPEGLPFMIYSGGRKVTSPAPKHKSFR